MSTHFSQKKISHSYMGTNNVLRRLNLGITYNVCEFCPQIIITGYKMFLLDYY